MTHFPVTTLGPGRRLGIWTQGCTLSCLGCMSRDTWDPNGGDAVEVEQLRVMWRAALDDGADGVTISGGEPLQQPHALRELLRAIADVSAAARRTCDILVYTGYAETELTDEKLAAVELADVLITGRYDVREPTTLRWRGSANQRLLLRTDLARARYAEFVEATTDANLQLNADGAGIRLIGVPTPGTLQELDRDLRALGIPRTAVTWRPTNS